MLFKGLIFFLLWTQVEWLHVPQTSLSTADFPLIRASHLTWMSPKQRQNLQQWLGAEPDRAANGDPGKKSHEGLCDNSSSQMELRTINHLSRSLKLRKTFYFNLFLNQFLSASMFEPQQ